MTDRATLDALFQRSGRSAGKLAQRFEKAPEFSEAEKNLPYLQLFLMSDPFGDKGHQARIRYEEFARIMSGIQGDISLTFDNIFSTSTGFAARHVRTNPAPRGMVLTWEHDLNGVSTVTLPLNSRPVDDRRWDLLTSVYTQLGAFRARTRNARLDEIDVIDINLVLGILLIILAKHSVLMRQSGLEGAIQIKARIGNLWRKAPFLDTPSYLRFIEHYGVPVIQNNTVLVPFGDITATIPATLPPVENIDRLELVSFASAAMPIFAEILAAFGIPFSALRDDPVELMSAVNRGSEAHRSGV